MTGIIQDAVLTIFGSISFFLVLFIVLVLATRFIYFAIVSRRNPPLPPGPFGLPLLGTVFEVNNKEPWTTYTDWRKTYGELVYTRLLNQDFIIINSEEIARALLDRRSKNYSDRPELVTTKLFGWSFNATFMHNDDRWRRHRQLLRQAFKPNVVLTYRPIQLHKLHQLLINILKSPEELRQHLQTMSSSLIMSIMYGYEAAPLHDSTAELVERSLGLALEAITPQAAAVLGLFPFLSHIPPWFPGAEFKQRALECQRLTTEMIETPFQYVKQSIASGKVYPCFVANIMNGKKHGGEPEAAENLAKNTAATSLVAGSESTASTLYVFVLAMVLYPRVQERAQAEIESVIGNLRLPTFEDRPSLPYIEAVLRETLRWHPIGPLSLPRVATDADIFDGYYIPKGATIIVNTWAMSRDESKYPNAEEFIPERFIGEDGELLEDIARFTFGFGRRVCVGRYMADATLWAGIVSLLAVFNFTKAKDARGNEIEFTPEWTTGLSYHPLPFPCHIEPRFADTTKLAQLVYSSADNGHAV